MSSDRPVLFVCLHGAAKSVLAAADFRCMAAERGLDIPAASAGTEPDPAIAPGVVRALLAEGVDLGDQVPRRLTRAEVAGAARVVAFGCDLGSAAPDGAPIEQWTRTREPSGSLKLRTVSNASACAGTAVKAASSTSSGRIPRVTLAPSQPISEGRCATMITVTPACLMPCSARSRRSSPSASWLALGSSSTTRRGSP